MGLLISLLSLQSQAQNQRIKDLKHTYSDSDNDSIKVATLVELTREYLSVYPDSLKYFAKELSKFQNNPDLPQARRNVTNTLGIYYYFQGNYDSSIYYFQQSYELAKEANDERAMSQIAINLGAIYSASGDREGALQTFFDQLNYYEEKDEVDSLQMAIVLTNIGTSYYYLKNYVKALEYGQKALVFERDPNGRITLLQNLGLAHIETAEKDSALYYYRKAYKQSTELNSTLNIGLSAKLIGDYYSETQQYDSAKRYLEKGVKLLEPLEYKMETGRSYATLGDNSYETKNYNEALDYHNKALQIFREVGTKNEIAEVQYKMSNDLSAIGRYKDAFDLLHQSKVLGDSLFSNRTAEAVGEMEVKYETEKKEKELALQTARLSQKELELSKQQLFRNVAVAGAFLLGVVALVIYQIKTKSNKVISTKNEQLGKSLSEREALLKEIHHRVKNNLQIIASLLYLQSDESENRDVRRLLEEGQGRVRSMALIHQKLYENDDLKHIPFEEYMKELIGEIKLSFGDRVKDVKLEIEAEGIFFDVDTAVPLGLIINELSTNAFKYAYAKMIGGGVFKVALKKDAKDYRLIVSDNGPGIPDQVLNTTQSSSLGLRLTRMLSEQLEGEYNFTNTSGTSFELKFAV